MFRSSSLKAEPGIGDAGDGSVFHNPEYYHVDSATIQQHIEEEPYAFNLHGAAEGGRHLDYQPPSRLPPDFPICLKKEPQDPDCEYPELRSPVETEYGQIPAHQMDPSQIEHGVSLEQIQLESPNDMNEDCSDNRRMERLKKECAVCKSEDTFFISHNLHANTAPVPVTLYGNLTQAAAMTNHEDLASAVSESTPKNEHVSFGLPVNRSHEKTVEINTGQCVDKPYACSSCDGSETSGKEFLFRPMISHSKGKPQWDNRYDEAALITHIVTQPERRDNAKGYTGEKPYICPYCDHRFGFKFSLTRHMRKHRDGQLFECSRCDSQSANKSDVVSHTITRTDVKHFECSSCDFRTNRHGKLVIHKRKHTGEKPFECSTCDFRAAQKSSLVTHIRKHTNEKPFECSICDFKTTLNDNLVMHMRSHTGEWPFECAICEFRTTRKSSLIRHIRTHTGEKSFECSICRFKTTRKDHLVLHMKAHTGEKPFECSMCDYKTARKSSLVQHVRVHRTHVGEKHYKCSLCDYRTVKSDHLTRHMRRHTEEKPYTCSYCDYRCGYKSVLDRHNRKHSGDKPFKCSSCGKTFSQKFNLVKHARQHTGIKPYMCSKCDYNAADKCKLVKHMAKH